MIDRETIQHEAKAILDKFSYELDKIKDKAPEAFVDREKDRRSEKEGKSCDPSFREAMLENAPDKEGDFIVAEKGVWTI